MHCLYFFELCTITKRKCNTSANKRNNFSIEGEEEGRTREAAELLAGLLKKLIRKPSSLIVLGPAPAPLTRLRSQYRWQILLKGIEVEALNDVCTRLLAGLPPVLKGKAIKLMVDVDPENML